ncbi:MAG: hypothetical protein IKU25_06705 [Clostridia bacterium]|nr:hypothetical protein [Clostridia bacterium]
MIKSLKKILFVLIIVVLIGALVYIAYKHINRYNSDNFIGLTAEEIIDHYGEFDRYSFWDSTGHYRTGVYVIKPKRVGFLGTHYEEYFAIRFDENGIAYECFHDTGGKGG